MIPSISADNKQKTFTHHSPSKEDTELCWTTNELHGALIWRPNKALGSDGSPFLPLWLVRTVAVIKHNSLLPSHINTAAITLWLKPDKDPALPTDLSLINAHIKVIPKSLSSKADVLLTHLEGYSTSLAWQRGATLKQQMRCRKGLWRSLLVFLFMVLHEVGFGKSFIHWIRSVCNSPKATVSTNSIISQCFTLASQNTGRGTWLSRQAWQWPIKRIFKIKAPHFEDVVVVLDLTLVLDRFCLSLEINVNSFCC